MTEDFDLENDETPGSPSIGSCNVRNGKAVCTFNDSVNLLHNIRGKVGFQARFTVGANRVGQRHTLTFDNGTPDPLKVSFMVEDFGSRKPSDYQTFEKRCSVVPIGNGKGVYRQVLSCSIRLPYGQNLRDLKLNDKVSRGEVELDEANFDVIAGDDAHYEVSQSVKHSIAYNFNVDADKKVFEIEFTQELPAATKFFYLQTRWHGNPHFAGMVENSVSGRFDGATLDAVSDSLYFTSAWGNGSGDRNKLKSTDSSFSTSPKVTPSPTKPEPKQLVISSSSAPSSTSFPIPESTPFTPPGTFNYSPFQRCDKFGCELFHCCDTVSYSLQNELSLLQLYSNITTETHSQSSVGKSRSIGDLPSVTTSTFQLESVPPQPTKLSGSSTFEGATTGYLHQPTSASANRKHHHEFSDTPGKSIDVPPEDYVQNATSFLDVINEKANSSGEFVLDSPVEELTTKAHAPVSEVINSTALPSSEVFCGTKNCQSVNQSTDRRPYRIGM